MPPEQQAKPVQCAMFPFNSSRLMAPRVGILLGTVDSIGVERFRSVTDNQYHADDVVILVDYHPYATDGAIGYDINPEDAGNPFNNGTPVYGKNGKTDPKEQVAPHLR